MRQRGASLSAGNDLTLAARENQVVIASRLAAGGDMRLVAEGDIALLSASDLDYRYRFEKEKKSFGRSQSEMSEFERGTAVLTELDAQNLTLSAGGGILGEGARLAAVGALKLESMGDIVLSAAENSTRSASAKSRTGFLGLTGEARKQGERQTSVVGTTLVGENIELASAGDMFLQATQLSAETARLVAGGDLAILSAAETTEAYSGKRKRSLSVVHDGLLRQDSIRADWEKSLVAPVGSVLEADVLALQSGGDLMVEGSRLTGHASLTLEAGDLLALVSARRLESSALSRRHAQWGEYGDPWLPSHGEAKRLKEQQRLEARQIGSVLVSGGDIALTSGGDQLYQSARLVAGGDIVLEAGGDIVFQAVKDLLWRSETKSGDYSHLWASMSGEGGVDETPQQSRLLAEGERIIRAAGKIRVDLTGEVSEASVHQTIAAIVAADPELAWLKELEEKGGIDWRRVKAVHEAWDYAHSGLTGLGGLVVAIVVTVLTWGAASGAVASVANGAGASTAAGSAWASGASAASAGWANAAATSGLVAMGANTATQLGTTGRVDFGQAFRAGLAGGIFGGVSSYFGSTYSLPRLLAGTMAGCVGAELGGGKCGKGAGMAFGLGLLGWAGDAMRDAMTEQSMLFGGICTGSGDEQVCVSNVSGPAPAGEVKIGGTRLNIQEICKTAESCAVEFREGQYWVNYVGDVGVFQKAIGDTSFSRLFGGTQGGPGVMFSIPYGPEGWQHWLVENYGGPHDYLNGIVWGGYETLDDPSALRFVGNAAVMSPWHYRFVEVMNILDVPLVTPFVAGMALSDTGSQWLLYRPKTEKKP